MVKFSRQFEAQLIPEWKDAFVDYRQLKKGLKKIHVSDNNNTSGTKEQAPLSAILSSSVKKIAQLGQKHREHGLIQVHRKLTSSTSEGGSYKTELLEPFADIEAASEFFASLDFQLNKVNQFYKAKEKEFIERGESLDKQLEILIALKDALEQKQRKGDQTNKNDPSISCHITSGNLNLVSPWRRRS